jgi:hypothetical protein
MASQVTLHDVEITKPVRAIICFGVPTATTGLQPGQFFTAIIDPNMVSPGGKFIRFDNPLQGYEVHGWQRTDGFTICEVLADHDYKWKDGKPPEGYVAEENAKVTVRAVKSWD